MSFLKMLAKLDTLCSPGVNIANVGYSGRLKIFFFGIFFSAVRFKSLLSFIMLASMLGLSWVLVLVCLVLRALNFRFVDIDLSQIGSIMFLDLMIRENALTRKSSRGRIFVLGSYFYEGNRYINDLYKEHVTFVRNPLLKLLLSPFFVSSVFADDSSHRYETVHSKVAVAHRVWNEYINEYGKPLIAMPKLDIEKAESELAKYVDINRPFVALHARETGFYNLASQNTRNADIKSYKLAIAFLIEHGFNVIRIGDSSMQSISEMRVEFGDALFDYANSDLKSELLDCYLLSHCAFMVGCSSGPNCIPPLFHLNCVNVNWYLAINAPNFMAGDITTIKRLYYRNTDELVPFKEILGCPFRWSPTMHELDKNGVYLVDNTEEEILGTVKEFIRITEVSSIQLEAKKLLPEDAYSQGSKGNFSMITLEQYFPDRL